MTEKIDATNLPGRKRREDAPPKRPQHEAEGRHLLPHEVAKPDYRLHRQDELASDPVIPAEIVGLGDNHGAFALFVRFPGHPELDVESEFVIGFEDGDERLETVEIAYCKPSTGAALNVPGGALRGVYEALIETYRNQLDQYRINVANNEGIELEPAGDVTPKLDSSRKSVLPGHNLDESELLIGVPNHGCSACCSRHNHCDKCHETQFPSSNVHLNFHYDLSCSHRSFFHPEPDEFAADCTCECGCQCGNCRRSRELIYAIVDPPLGAWSRTFEVINESLSFHSGEPIFLVEFESVEKTPENQWSIAIEGSVDELNGPLIPDEFEIPDELRVMLEAEMRAAIRDACQRLMAKMTAEVAEATAPSKPPMNTVAAANYTLDLRVEFATDPAIPATVVEIIYDDDDALRVTATFPGHPELTEIGVFVIDRKRTRLNSSHAK